MEDEANKAPFPLCSTLKRFRKRKIDPKVLLASDFEESAFKSLGDVE